MSSLHPQRRPVVPASSAAGAATSAKVRAILRVRPALSSETDDSCLHVPPVPGDVVRTRNPRNDQETLSFRFDQCYEQAASQLAIFARDVAPLVERALAGFNATIFAYGNTGAGKTFTMEGTPQAPGTVIIMTTLTRQCIGMIPLAMQYVLESLKKSCQSVVPQSGQPRRPTGVKISYLEIYKEKVYDLLAATMQDLPIREDAHRNIMVPDLITASVATLAEFEALWQRGVTNRRTAATRLNAHSSRSHACLTIHLPATEPAMATATGTTAKLHLIDLAGSEDNRRTANCGERLLESGAINRSLFVLGQVVDALNAGANRIPYRDSKLTRLLQDSLGGRAYALIIANVAPGVSFAAETVSTLNFAAKARQIDNSIVPACLLGAKAEDRGDGMRRERRARLVGSDEQSSSPTTMASSAEVKRVRTRGGGDRENNPFEAQDHSLQSMILERRIEEKVAEKLRQISHGTILSPLLKGEAAKGLRSQLLQIKEASPLLGRKRPKKMAEARSAGKKGPEPFGLDPQVEPLLPLVEPELLRILNYGSLREICRQINEIGTKRAQAIVAHREAHGEICQLRVLVDAGLLTNRVLGKIILANSLGHVDFVPALPSGPTKTVNAGERDESGRDAGAVAPTSMTRRVNPLCLASEQDS